MRRGLFPLITVGLGLIAGPVAAQCVGFFNPGAQVWGRCGFVNGVGGVALPFAPTGGFADIGDSRIANGGGLLTARNATSFSLGHNFGNGFPELFSIVTNNAVLDTPSGHYGSGATTSLQGLARAYGTYTDATLYSAPENITASNYNSGTGLVTLTVGSQVHTYSSGSPVTVSGVTGSGTLLAAVNAQQTTVTVSNTSVSFTIATGLSGSINSGTGTVAGGCSQNLTDYCSNSGGSPSSSPTNWAATSTLVPSDGKWNDTALGTSYLMADAATVTNLLYGVNDGSAAFYGAQSPAAIGTINNLSSIMLATAAKGSQVFVLDETPRTANGTIYAETHAVTCPSPCTATATHTNGIIDGSTYGDIGVVDQANNVLTKVTSGPGNGQYSLNSATGVFTFSTTTSPLPAPTNVWLTYVYNAGNGATSTYDQIVHQWEDDTSSNFTPTIGANAGIPYGIAGACNKSAYPHNVCVPIWTTLNGGSGTVAANGFFDVLGLHPSLAGAIAAAVPYAAAWKATYPSYSASLAQSPTFNNWYAAKGNNSAVTYGSGVTIGSYTSTTFPGVMAGTNCAAAAAAGNLRITINGDQANYLLASGGGTGTWIGQGTYAGNLSSTSYNCSTGAWSITFSSGTKPALNAIVEVVEDPTNMIDNGLFDSAQTTPFGAVPCPANFTCNNGTPIAGYTYSVGVPLATALAAGVCATTSPCGTASMTATTVTDPDGTWPALQIQMSGTLASAATFVVQGGIAGATNKITAGQKYRGGLSASVGAGPNGHLYGMFGVQEGGQIQTSSFHPYASCTSCNLGNSNATILASTFASSSLVPWTDLALTTWTNGFGGSAIILPELGDLVDTTGATITGGSNINTIELVGGPFSFTVTLWRDHIRVRSQ